MITGFQATLEVDDAGTGAASGGASTKFSGLTTFNLPSLEAGKFDATELDQKNGGNVDPYEREEPTGLIKMGPIKGEMKYTKANYQRLQALLEKAALGDRGYTFIATTPDDLSTPGTPVKLTGTWDGWVSKLDDVKFEKGNPVLIPFEITPLKKGTLA